MPKPAGTATGDLMILSMRVDGGWNGDTAPSGWTALRTGSFYRWVTGADAAATAFEIHSYFFAAGDAGATITTFRGVDPTTPFASAGGTLGGSDSSVELPNQTATRPGSWRFSPITVAAARSATYPAGMTESADCSGDSNGVSSAYEVVGPGTTPTRVVTLSGSGSWTGQTYVLNAVPDPPSITALSPAAGPTAGGTTVTITGAFLTGATGVTFGGTAATGLTVVNDSTATVTAPARAAGSADVRITTAYGTSADAGTDDDYTYQLAPTVTAVSPAQGPTAGGTSVVITGTGFANLAGASAVRFGATNASSYTVDSATQITATAPAGSGTQSVRVVTPGGTSADTASDDYAYRPAPTITALAPASGPTAGGNAVTITGTDFAGLGGASAVRFGATNASSYTVDSPTQITAVAPAGSGVQSVRVTTAGGTSADGPADDYTFRPPPTVAAISPSSGPGSGGTVVTITGTDFAALSGASAVRFGATNASSYTVDSPTQITATAPAGTGVQNVRVTTPGGTSTDTPADDFTYVPAPTIAAITPAGGPTAGGTVVVITGTDFAGLAGPSAVRFGPTDASSYTVDSPTQITATAPAGSGTVDVRVTTPGGTSANTGADDYGYLAVPSVTALAPSSGPQAGGTTVTITGTGFALLSGPSAVQFGGVDATSYVVVNATTITAVAPAGTGTARVRVTTPGGISADTAADDFRYLAAPTITSITPASGPTAGGTTVTITGTNFTLLSGASAVRFGATNAAGYTVVNDTTITASSPAGSGTQSIRVTTPGGTTAGTAADDFSFRNPPTVAALSPVTGPAAGGTSVTITGTFLAGATGVQFGGVAATFSVVNATTITATAPAGSGVVSVRVTTPDGTSPDTSADNFTYLAAPTVTGVSPGSGPDLGGTVVTITGTGFTGATAVRFGSVNASGFTVVNATTITATAPPHVAGVVGVRVTSSGGTSADTPADDYSYVGACGLGTLGVTASDVLFDPFTLNGLDQTRTKTAGISVSDMTGLGLGWKLEMGTTRFSAGAGRTLPEDAARITNVVATPRAGACTAPTPVMAALPLDLPILPSKERVYSAQAGTGRGVVDLSLAVELDVPANTMAGTYASTWNVDLTAAP